MLSDGTTLNNRWKIGKLVGQGACGEVYATRELNNSSNESDIEYVVKVSKLVTGTSKKAKEQIGLCNTLFFEFTLYTGVLFDFPYRPQHPNSFYGEDKQLSVRYIVLERLERDLEAVCKDNNFAFSTIGEYGLQILDGLQWMHKKSYLYIDVKPQNFMIKNGKLYFVDYGLMERWVSFDNKGSKPLLKKALIGTPDYVSQRVLEGYEASRIDDLESMALVLLSLTSQGLLPWSIAKSPEETMELRKEHDVIKICKDRNCAEIGKIIQKCRESDFNKIPDYDFIRDQLNQMLIRCLKEKVTVSSNVKSKPKVVDVAPISVPAADDKVVNKRLKLGSKRIVNESNPKVVGAVEPRNILTANSMTALKVVDHSSSITSKNSVDSPFNATHVKEYLEHEDFKENRSISTSSSFSSKPHEHEIKNNQSIQNVAPKGHFTRSHVTNMKKPQKL